MLSANHEPNKVSTGPLPSNYTLASRGIRAFNPIEYVLVYVRPAWVEVAQREGIADS